MSYCKWKYDNATCNSSKTLEEALKISEEDIIQALGGLPEDKKHCSNLGVKALRNDFKLIDVSHIKAYKCENISITSVLEKYNNNELEEINISGPAHH